MWNLVKTREPLYDIDFFIRPSVKMSKFLFFQYTIIYYPILITVLLLNVAVATTLALSKM